MAKPNPDAEKVVKHFTEERSEWDDDMTDVGALEYKELTEDLLAEYIKVSERLKSMEDIKEMLRQNILKTMGKDESAQRGQHVCFIKTEERKGSVDYNRLLKDREITEAILEQYRKPASIVKKIEVKKL